MYIIILTFSNIVNANNSILKRSYFYYHHNLNKMNLNSIFYIVFLCNHVHDLMDQLSNL